MPKNIIQTQEVVKLAGTKVIPNPFSTEIESREGEDSLHSLTERIKELREEAESILRRNQIYRETLIAQAKDEAAKIIEEAGKRGDALLETKINESDAIRDEIDGTANKTIEDAKIQAKAIVEEANREAETIRANARGEAYQEGLAKGLEKGKADIVYISDQLHMMLNKVIERRNDMIDELEGQLVRIIMMMVQKIVKTISEKQRTVVIQNIIHSLRKLKRQVDVLIRVNISDKKISEVNKEKILKIAPQIERVTIVEDTTVDPGGCIVETDYGKIDARITTQLEELERQMQHLNPIKVEK